MARSAEPPVRASPNGWRALGLFWLVILSVAGAGGGVLQYLGPPAPAGHAPEARTESPRPESPPREASSQEVPRDPGPTADNSRPGTISGPDPALLEAAGSGLREHLPRRAPDGRVAMRVYAAGFDGSAHLPRVAVLVAGHGLDAADSTTAINTLPGAVSLAVSPYATAPEALLTAARAKGHEYLVAVPLEPTGYPLNDPGPQTLLTAAPPEENLRRLRWALSRIDGYAGVTGVIGTMRGERLAAMPDQMEPMLTELATRGLFYIDPLDGGGALSHAWGRHIDLVIDEPGTAEAIDARLTALEQQARDHGTALGLVMRPTPVALTRLAAWANGVTGRGVALAPVSNLGLAPRDGAPDVRRFRIE